MTRRRVLVTMCIWFVMLVSLWVSGSRPAVIVLGGIVAVVVVVVLVTIDLAGTVSRVRWTRRSGQPGSTRKTDRRVSALRHQVYGAWLSGSTQINETLVELLDDRLLSNHRIIRAPDSPNSDRLLTPSLRRLTAGPRRQTATVRELRQVLTDIEAL